MAKAKFTNKGNVQVTMTEDQYIALRAILDKVVLGHGDRNTKAITDLVVDLTDNFETNVMGLDEYITEACDVLGVQLETDHGELSWSIKFN
jgi:hypothetical protein